MIRLTWAMLPALVVFLGLAASAVQAEDQPVKFVKEWIGKFPKRTDEPLMKEAPKSGYIADAKAWAKLWKAWRGKDALPKVDFAKQLVLVGTAGCAANRIGARFRLTDKGDLQGGFIATEIGGPGFVYMIAVIDRAGVKSVNGKSLEKD